MRRLDACLLVVLSVRESEHVRAFRQLPNVMLPWGDT